jgi:hypothetical protein
MNNRIVAMIIGAFALSLGLAAVAAEDPQYKAAKAECKKISGEERREACMKDAKAAHELAEAKAKADRKAAHEAKEAAHEKAEAARKEAREKAEDKK